MGHKKIYTDVDFRENRVTGVPDPNLPLDAINKQYIDELFTPSTGNLPPNGVSVFNINPIGVKNGVNTVFTLPYTYYPTTLRVFLNGQRLTLTADYAETNSTTITFVDAPISSDTLVIDLNTI